MREKKRARLENWYTQTLSNGVIILNGNVYDHPKFEAGQFIHTSEVVKVNEDRTEAVTLNTIYTLHQELE